MALKVSALLSNVRVPLYTCSLYRTYFKGANFKFKHLLTPGTPYSVRKSATDPLHVYMNGSLKAKKVSTTAGLWMSSQGIGSFVSSSSRGCLRLIALGVALGVSGVILVRSLHTGTLTAMTHKVNLNSDEGDWKETKDFLLSLSGKDRRQYYRTSNHVPLEDIPVWSPVGGDSGKAFYQRNEKLNKKISLYCGDITKLEIDAIVNAANETLLGGGGVDGAIHRAAGPMLKKECASLHGCQTGDAKLTCGYGLPAKFVIHTVGPIASGGVGEAERKALMSCYKNSLKQATKAAARSVAFPCISTGIYGYPNEQAAHEALAAVREYLDDHHDKLDRVIFCVFLPMDKKIYLQNLHLYFPSDSTVKSKL